MTKWRRCSRKTVLNVVTFCVMFIFSFLHICPKGKLGSRWANFEYQYLSKNIFRMWFLWPKAQNREVEEKNSKLVLLEDNPNVHVVSFFALVSLRMPHHRLPCHGELRIRFGNMSLFSPAENISISQWAPSKHKQNKHQPTKKEQPTPSIPFKFLN